MKEIPLTQGKVALVDDEDYARVSKYKWTAFRWRGRWYAFRGETVAIRKRTIVWLHRFVLGVTSSVDVDHKDRNGLNCSRNNLRVATRSQNNQNARKRRHASSRYKGVCWSKQKGRWYARIYVDGKPRSLGLHRKEIAAARVYDNAAKKHFGEFARLNFPQPAGAAPMM